MSKETRINLKLTRDNLSDTIIGENPVKNNKEAALLSSIRTELDSQSGNTGYLVRKSRHEAAWSRFIKTYPSVYPINYNSIGEQWVRFVKEELNIIRRNMFDTLLNLKLGLSEADYTKFFRKVENNEQFNKSIDNVRRFALYILNKFFKEEYEQNIYQSGFFDWLAKIEEEVNKEQEEELLKSVLSGMTAKNKVVPVWNVFEDVEGDSILVTHTETGASIKIVGMTSLLISAKDESHNDSKIEVWKGVSYPGAITLKKSKEFEEFDSDMVGLRSPMVRTADTEKAKKQIPEKPKQIIDSSNDVQILKDIYEQRRATEGERIQQSLLGKRDPPDIKVKFSNPDFVEENYIDEDEMIIYKPPNYRNPPNEADKGNYRQDGRVNPKSLNGSFG